MTISVSDLDRSKDFYENTLGFEPDVYYEPTRWQCYKSEGRAYLGLAEVADYSPPAAGSIVNFEVVDVTRLWEQVKDRAQVEAPFGPTEWGSIKFVILDPDGNRLGFLGRRQQLR